MAFGAVTCTMIVISALLMWAFTGELQVRDAGIGWVLAIANGAAALWIYAQALRKTGNRFLLWAIGFSTVRLLCTLVLLIALFVLVISHRIAYLTAALTGYVCFLIWEIRYVQVAMRRTRAG